MISRFWERWGPWLYLLCVGALVVALLITNWQGILDHWHWLYLLPGGLLLVGIVYDLPQRLVTKDLGPGSQFQDEAKRVKAINNVRTTLFQGVAGAALLIGLFFTARQVWLTSEGQITDRYTKAIDQLGNRNSRDVRVGGIYALERIGRDSLPPDRPDWRTIVEVLSTFVRTQPPANDEIPLPVRASDVQAAMTVLGRNEWHVPIDLHGADIHGANLHTAEREVIPKAFFDRADFRGADLRKANLREAHLMRADFVHAPLSNPPIQTRLNSADLRGADLRGADLSEAHLESANLSGAIFTSALGDPGEPPIPTHLKGAHLEGADLRGAKADNQTQWPEDFGKTDEKRRETAKARGVQFQ